MVGGFGGMLSVRVHGGEERARAVAAAVRVFKRATSLGGVESLIEHRASSEGPSSLVPADLLRLSIGLEATQDRISDLEAALDHASLTAHVQEPAATLRREPSAVALDLVDHVAAALQASVAPMVIARGGALRVLAVENGIAMIEASRPSDTSCGRPSRVGPAVA